MLTDWLYGLALGIAYGAVCGYLKYFFVWRPIFNAPSKGEKGSSAVMVRSAISMLLNLLILLVVYLLKAQLPTLFAPTIIGAAFALSLASRLYPVSKLANPMPQPAAQTDNNAAPSNQEKEE